MHKAWLRRCIWITLGLAASLLGVLVFFPGFFLGLPTAQSIYKSALAPSSLILDRHGQLLYEMIDPHAGLHRPLELGEIPLALRQAIIATEDASFYRNPGIDLRAMARALWQNLRQREIVSGASTITQQLARNLLMGADERAQQSWQRKLHELLLAYHITRTLSKDEILALYLNETYFGNMAYGVEAAARAYFGKPVAQLDLAECTLLAGLPQSPADYNPLTNLPAAKERQQAVLALMVKAGYIAAQQAELAQSEPLHFAATSATIEAPHFCAFVRDELAQRLGEQVVRQGGLRIHTTLDLDLQRAAEAEVQRHLAQLNAPQPDMPGHNVHNAALVTLDEDNGAVRAMVGSPDYFDSAIDGAVNAALALRQPGSAIKPITYAAAFARGYTPATMLPDVRTSFLTREGTPYVPVNYDYRFHGPVLLRQALACSYNVVAVKLLDRIGADAMTATARQLGITSLDDAERQGLALTLGSCEVQLLQLTAAYGVLANGGWRVRPYSIDYVEDRYSHVIYRATPEPPGKVLDERIAYLVTDILADSQARVPTFGEGSVLELPFPAAVKTGTTTEWRDNWTVGYTTKLVTGVWVGNADNQPMLRASGVSGAAPIWNAVMRAAHRQAPPAFRRPAGLVEVMVCAESGLLPGVACDHRKRELFLAEDVPMTLCDWHRLVAFDKTTGKAALADCPSERRTYRSVTFWPRELLAWAGEEGLPLPPDSSPKMALASVSDLRRSPAMSVSQQEQAGLYLSSPDANSSYSISPSIAPRFQQIEVSTVCPPEIGLRQVSLWVDGQRWYTWSAPPYRVWWPLQPGMHEFWVEGMDGQSQTVRSAPVRITVRDERSQ